MSILHHNKAEKQKPFPNCMRKTTLPWNRAHFVCRQSASKSLCMSVKCSHQIQMRFCVALKTVNENNNNSTNFDSLKDAWPVISCEYAKFHGEKRMKNSRMLRIECFFSSESTCIIAKLDSEFIWHESRVININVGLEQ